MSDSAASPPIAPDASDTDHDEDRGVEPRGSEPSGSDRRRVIEWVVVIGGAVLVAVLVRTFVLQTFWIPSESMMTTLAPGDRVIVNKLSYRLGDVHRGDVVVFHRPAALPSSDPDALIKRVIAVGGDSVSIIDDTVRIDGRPLDEPYTHGLPTTPQVSCPITPPTQGIDTTAGFTVPDGEVLVLGDNRTDSTDGRCFGPVSEDSIVGRAEVVFWPPGRAGRL